VQGLLNRNRIGSEFQESLAPLFSVQFAGNSSQYFSVFCQIMGILLQVKVELLLG